jgi:hypothetical protein
MTDLADIRARDAATDLVTASAERRADVLIEAVCDRRALLAEIDRLNDAGENWASGYDRGAADERLRIAVHVGNLPQLLGVGKQQLVDAVDRAAVIRIIDREA